MGFTYSFRLPMAANACDPSLCAWRSTSSIVSNAFWGLICHAAVCARLQPAEYNHWQCCTLSLAFLHRVKGGCSTNNALVLHAFSCVAHHPFCFLLQEPIPQPPPCFRICQLVGFLSKCSLLGFFLSCIDSLIIDFLLIIRNFSLHIISFSLFTPFSFHSCLFCKQSCKDKYSAVTHYSTLFIVIIFRVARSKFLRCSLSSQQYTHHTLQPLLPKHWCLKPNFDHSIWICKDSLFHSLSLRVFFQEFITIYNNCYLPISLIPHQWTLSPCYSDFFLSSFPLQPNYRIQMTLWYPYGIYIRSPIGHYWWHYPWITSGWRAFFYSL